MQTADAQPDSCAEPNHLAVDETVIQINDQHHWLYAAVDPGTNDILQVRLFQTCKTQLTVLLLRELREQQQVGQATFLVGGATHLAIALDRLGLDLRYEKREN